MSKTLIDNPTLLIRVRAHIARRANSRIKCENLRYGERIRLQGMISTLREESMISEPIYLQLAFGIREAFTAENDPAELGAVNRYSLASLLLNADDELEALRRDAGRYRALRNHRIRIANVASELTEGTLDQWCDVHRLS